MKKAILWIIVVIIAMALTFTGISCKKEAVTEATAAAEVTDDSVETAAKATEEITIHFWSKFTAEESGGLVMARLFEQYMEDNPNVKIVSNFAGRGVSTALMSAIQAGNPPDIYDEDPFQIHNTIGREGLAVDLMPYIENETGWKEDKKIIDIVFPGYFDAWNYEGEGVTCLSYQTLLSSIWYNKTLWSNLGLTENDIPATWSEFTDLCEKIKASGVAPISQDGGIDFYNFYWYSYMADRMEGPGALREAITDRTGASWDKPGFLEAAKKLEEIVNSGYFIEGFEGYMWPAGQIDWAQGKGAMILIHNYFVSEVADAVPDDFVFGSFPFPTIEGGEGNRFDLAVYPMGASILKSSEHIDISFDILKRTLSLEWQQELTDKTGSLPVRAEGVVLSETIEDLQGILESQTAFFKDYGTGSGHVEPELQTTVILPLTDRLIKGLMTAEDFIKELKEGCIKYWDKK